MFESRIEMSIVQKIEIAKNIFMPIIGIGTWEMREKTLLYKILDTALSAGYRFIDTAHVYGNEVLIGKILKLLLPKYNLSRADVFITSKLPTTHQGSALARQAIEESLKNLQTDYLDLYLIHFPGKSSFFPKPNYFELNFSGAYKVKTCDSATLRRLRSESWAVLEEFQSESFYFSLHQCILNLCVCCRIW